MRKIVALIISMFCLFLLSGCAATIAGHADISKHFDKIYKGVDELCKTTPCGVNYLKAALGSDINRLPAEAVMVLDDVIMILKTAKSEGRPLSEEESCTIAGKWDRFIYLVGRPVAEQIIGFLVKL